MLEKTATCTYYSLDQKEYKFKTHILNGDNEDTKILTETLITLNGGGLG